MFKFICILGLVIMTCHQFEAAPHQHNSLKDMSQTELVHKFDEFMHDEKQMAAIQSLYEKEVVGHELRKRQAEAEIDDADDSQIQKAEGFIDRAAKFVMEVLQRFLKWINQD